MRRSSSMPRSSFMMIPDTPTGNPAFIALGQTDAGRSLFVVFTIRDTLIRVISARDMNRKEREVYRRS
jgi:uncharacterized DUF497 family protein